MAVTRMRFLRRRPCWLSPARGCGKGPNSPVMKSETVGETWQRASGPEAETAGTDCVPAGTAQKCGALSSGLRSPYWGLSGAKNWELIQPFQRVFSTWTQSPSRPVAVNCVPLGAVPRTGAFAEAADLMLTPGRCKKTRSGFCAVEAVWGVTAWAEAAAVSEAATSREGTTPDAPGDGSATVGAACT